MKFGNLLHSTAYEPWRFYYLDYDRLKSLLKEAVLKKGQLDEYDERQFVETLDGELEKVKI